MPITTISSSTSTRRNQKSVYILALHTDCTMVENSTQITIYWIKPKARNVKHGFKMWGCAGIYLGMLDTRA